MSPLQSADRFAKRRQAQLRETGLADRASLEILGFILGGVTVVVFAIAVIVVRSHVDTGAAAAPRTPVVPAALSAQR